MSQASNRSDRPLAVAIPLTVLVGVIATTVAYLGTRENPRAPAAPWATPIDTSLPVQTIVLPHDEPELPPGPHQRTFIASCTVCHSTRLVLTQPPLRRQQWVEVVRKMVKTYGAPITPEAETQIVDYLVTLPGL
jgi:hypothetical protein